MVKFFSQTFKYDDAWATVTLAFFLRYPNPHSAHVLTCDVISRTVTDQGTLKTTRLIKKSGGLPSWFPKQLISRPESWLVEESEVDPEGKMLSCRTRNLDHVKVMRVQEDVLVTETDDQRTTQKSTVSILSTFGWGLTKKIEQYGIAKFKSNLERSRKGVAAVLTALRESRQHLGSQMYAATGVGSVLGSSLSTAARQDWTPSTSASSSVSLSTLDRDTSTSLRADDTVRRVAAPATSVEPSTLGTIRGVFGAGGLGLGGSRNRPTVLAHEEPSVGERRSDSPSSVSSID